MEKEIIVNYLKPIIKDLLNSNNLENRLLEIDSIKEDISNHPENKKILSEIKNELEKFDKDENYMYDYISKNCKETKELIIFVKMLSMIGENK